MVRNIDGQGLVMTRSPPLPGSVTGLPDSSTTSATTPGSGCVQEPGLVAMAPGTGDIMIMPVSVCHQVSTIGSFSLPITRWYHIQASGLIGSPTLPSNRSFDRSYVFGNSSPALASARIAVGAV